MDGFFVLIIAFYNSIIHVLSYELFTVFGFPISLMSFIFVSLFLGFIVNVFWKGAKT